MSKEQLDYQERDRFPIHALPRPVSAASGTDSPTTVWQYGVQPLQAGVVDQMFGGFDGYLKSQGWSAMGAQKIYALIVHVPEHRAARGENRTINAGATPERCNEKTAKER